MCQTTRLILGMAYPVFSPERGSCIDTLEGSVTWDTAVTPECAKSEYIALYSGIVKKNFRAVIGIITRAGDLQHPADERTIQYPSIRYCRGLWLHGIQN